MSFSIQHFTCSLNGAHSLSSHITLRFTLSIRVSSPFTSRTPTMSTTHSSSSSSSSSPLLPPSMSKPISTFSGYSVKSFILLLIVW